MLPNVKNEQIPFVMLHFTPTDARMDGRKFLIERSHLLVARAMFQKAVYETK
jgi:hypothetical protein